MAKIYKATLYFVDINEQINSKGEFLDNIEIAHERSYLDGRMELFDVEESDDFEWEESSAINVVNVHPNEFEKYLKKETEAEKMLKKIKKEYEGKEDIELNKEYFVSEWSWQPISDGYGVYKQTIRAKAEVDGETTYITGTNYRKYQAWDIFETEEEAQKMSDLKNSFGYDWAIHCDIR